MNEQASENLELLALQQRSRLHQRADELRAKIEAEKAKLNLTQQARKHFLAASILTSILGLSLGYGLTGVFTKT